MLFNRSYHNDERTITVWLLASSEDCADIIKTGLDKHPVYPRRSSNEPWTIADLLTEKGADITSFRGEPVSQVEAEVQRTCREVADELAIFRRLLRLQ